MDIDDARLYKEIGQRLRGHRRRVKRSQGEVAEALGIVRSSLANIEAGRQRLTIHTLYRICAELNISASEALPSVSDFVMHTPVSAIAPEHLPELAQAVLAQLDLRFTDESSEGEGDEQAREGASTGNTSAPWIPATDQR